MAVYINTYMESLFNSLLPIIGPGGIGILAAVYVYVKINTQRKETKSERDENLKLIEYRISKLESNQTSLIESIKELQNSIISLQMSVNELVLEIKHMKEVK